MSLHRHLLILASLNLVGCTSVPHTRSILTDRGTLPTLHAIQGVPLIEQSSDFCGPVSLATVALFAGVHTSVDELASLTLTPAKRGALQLDLIGASRRIGMLALPVSGLRPLLTEVTADHPVLVLLNLGSSANPVWHYAVVVGFDLREEEVILHAGESKPWRMAFSRFERAWKKADDWALLVVSAETLPVTASAQELLLAATALERVGRTREANAAYRMILTKWSDQLVALFGLGNTHAALGQWSQSAKAFERASSVEPRSAAIWRNLAEVYGKLQWSKREAEARKKVYALDASGSEE